MRTKFLNVGLCLVAFLGGFLLTAGAEPNDHPITIDPLPRVAVLTPTTNAPASARGEASFILPSIAFQGTNAPDLHVTTQFLPGGIFTVSITDNESNAYTLGTFSVPTFTNHNVAAVPMGQGSFALPDGLNPTNVVGVSILDSNAVVDLTGIFPAPFHLPPPEIHETILLAATNDAPVNATGRASLDTDYDAEDAPLTGAVVTVEAVGLPAGAYTVTLTDVTGTNTFVLGTLEENTRSNRLGYAYPTFVIFGQSNTTGQAQFALPDGLNPTNAASVSIIGSNSLVELTGDFARPTNTLHCGFDNISALVPGPICTNLHGNALLQIKSTHGKTHDLFSLIAQDAPANQKFDLLINGVSVGTVKSNKRGQIAIKKLPKGIELMDVMTLEADDSSSNTVFSVTF